MAVVATLTHMMDDDIENNITRHDGKGILNKMSRNYKIMSVVWGFLLFAKTPQVISWLLRHSSTI